MNARPATRSAAVLAAALLFCLPPFGVADGPAAPYASARITAPADGEGLRANSGDFVVRAHIEPDLRQGHRLRLLLNGNAQGAAQTSAAFLLTGVARGEHQLQLQVVDEGGSIVFEGESSTFHLLRHSILHRRPATNP